MSALERARAGAKRMLARFPHEDVTVKRPAKNKYGELTGDEEEVGTARIWTDGLSKPSGWKVEDAGQKFADAGAIWASLPYHDAPDAQHGDIVVFADGRRRVIRNIQHQSTDLRVFWQLAEA